MKLTCFIFISLIVNAHGIIDIRSFFPFGIENGDQYLAPGDDSSSVEQPLSMPFNFYNYSHTSLWVNVNGAISFLSPIGTYTPSCQPVPQDFRMVSPFWADVDTKYETPSPASAISFRESNSTADLQQAQREVEYAYNITDIELTWAYIVTWYNVTFYGDDPSRTIRNTFQAALTSNGINSFVIFYYNKIQWTTGQASGGNDNGLGGTPAQVGFDAGDGQNRYMLDVSCTGDVINVNERTNMGVPGEFVFQVDGNLISTPPPLTRPTRETLPPTTTNIPASTAPPTTPPLPTTTEPISEYNLDRKCGNTRKKIWLDIIAVIDTSLSMNKEGLAQVKANLAAVIGQMNINSVPGYSTRIALVKFASNATVAAPFEAFNDTHSFTKTLFNNISLTNGDNNVNILSGLQTANTILTDKKVSNRRRVVILYTSAYDDTGFESPVKLSLTMRAENIKIITVAFSQSMDSDEVTKVGELAWPKFNFTNNQDGLADQIYDSLGQANCFCPPNWQQYTTNFNDEYAPGYGVCMLMSSIPSSWTAASYSCPDQAAGAYLVTESTEEKHNFNFAYSKKTNTNGQLAFHIGLQYQNGQYSWQQSDPDVTIPLNPGYSQWNPGYPNQNIGQCVKNDKVIGQNYQWTNEDCDSKFLNYICEVSTCDTDNYCPPVPDSKF